MAKETVLIIGLGEIGHSLFRLLYEKQEIFAVYGLDLDEKKMYNLSQNKDSVPSEIDKMQICLPCGNPEKFAKLSPTMLQSTNPK